MALVARLVTFVDIDSAEASGLSFCARHDALLADGRRIMLLGDRGWSQSSRMHFWPGGEPPMREPASPWEGVTREDIEESARAVVGPDEAYGECTQAEVDEAHWAYLATALQKQGVDVDACDLKALPHDVQLGDRLLARLADRSRW